MTSTPRSLASWTLGATLPLGVGSVWLASSWGRPAGWIVVIPVILTWAGIVVLALFLHRAWSRIQDDRSPVKPGPAAFFLLIPLFNFYWAFRALPGFASEHNAFAARHALPIPRLPQAWFLCGAVLFAASPLPWVGVAAAIGLLMVLPIVMWSMADAMVRLDGAATLWGGGSVPSVQPSGNPSP